MRKMNNKAQVLVLFAIILPVILLLLLVTIQIGNLYLDKQKTKSTIKETITTVLKNNEENKKDIANNLIEINIKDIKTKTIYISENEIEINVTQEKQLFGKNIDLKYKLKGMKDGDNIRISEG